VTLRVHLALIVLCFNIRSHYDRSRSFRRLYASLMEFPPSPSRHVASSRPGRKRSRRCCGRLRRRPACTA